MALPKKSKSEFKVECFKTIDCLQGAVRSVRFNVDGAYCLTSGSDNKIKLWNPYKSLLLKTYGGHGNEVMEAVGSCDSSHIISASLDKSVILWDVATGQPVRRLRGHAGGVTTVRFNEDSSMAFSGGRDNVLNAWDLKARTYDPVQSMKDAKDCITAVRVSSFEIVTASVDGHIRIYDIRKQELVDDYIGETVVSLALTGDDQCVIASCSTEKIYLIDKTNGQELEKYIGHKVGGLVVDAVITPDDNFILTGSSTGQIYCWELLDPMNVTTFMHTEGKATHSLATHPKSKILISASRGEIKVWGAEDEIDRQLESYEL